MQIFAPQAPPTVAVPTQVGNEFLVFSIGNEEYGVGIQQVQELRHYEAVTWIANAPAFVKGVINLRGIIVPIIDLRIKLGMGLARYDAFTVVIILNLDGRVVGVVVDGVSDVLTLLPEHVKPAPDLAGEARSNACLTGIGTVDQRMLILVDIERMVGDDALMPDAALAA